MAMERALKTNRPIVVVLSNVELSGGGEVTKNQETDGNVTALPDVDFSGDVEGSKNQHTDSNVIVLSNVDFRWRGR